MLMWFKGCYVNVVVNCATYVVDSVCLFIWIIITLLWVKPAIVIISLRLVSLLLRQGSCRLDGLFYSQKRHASIAPPSAVAALSWTARVHIPADEISFKRRVNKVNNGTGSLSLLSLKGLYELFVNCEVISVYDNYFMTGEFVKHSI